MLFQQLSTNGLPYPMSRWEEFEDYAEDLQRSGMISVPSRSAGTSDPPAVRHRRERTADSVPTLAELGCVAALTQCFAEHIARGYAAEGHLRVAAPVVGAGEQMARGPIRMDAEVITPRQRRPSRSAPDWRSGWNDSPRSPETWGARASWPSPASWPTTAPATPASAPPADRSRPCDCCWRRPERPHRSDNLSGVKPFLLLATATTTKPPSPSTSRCCGILGWRPHSSNI